MLAYGTRPGLFICSGCGSRTAEAAAGGQRNTKQRRRHLKTPPPLPAYDARPDLLTRAGQRARKFLGLLGRFPQYPFFHVFLLIRRSPPSNHCFPYPHYLIQMAHAVHSGWRGI